MEKESKIVLVGTYRPENAAWIAEISAEIIWYNLRKICGE